jgi:prevent-host-death family protein
MPNLTATQVKRHFGQALDQAQHDPVFISRAGKPTAVLLSWDALQTVLKRSQQSAMRPDVEGLVAQSIATHHDLYRALSKLG